MLLPAQSGHPAGTRRCHVLTTIVSEATANKPSLKDVLLALFPSYISRRFQDPPPSPPKLSPTSFLDGLRGIAALFVLFFHATWTHLGAVELGYGLDGQNHSWLQLPFVRLVYAGHAMVCVFFVVGGYVVALKPLRKMREGSWDGLLTTASSCLMRRGLRLYLPAMVASLLSAVTVYLGWWEPARTNIATAGVIYFPDFHPRLQPTLFAQLANWWEHTWGLLNVWTYTGTGPTQPYYNHYDPHLWTVPYEFRSSLILVLVLVALARCRTAVRWLLVLALVLFNAAWARWEVVLFLAGAWLAELDMVTGARGRPAMEEATYAPPATRPEDGGGDEAPRRAPMRRRSPRAFALATVFVLGLYLLSCPPRGIDKTPGYVLLVSLVPASYGDPKRFIHGAGAMATVWAVSNSPALQRPLLTGGVQYLGRISYSLYIVHGPVLHVVGYVVTPALWRSFGSETALKWTAGFVLGNALTFAVVFWLADLFWRGVDARSAGIGRMFEELCIGGK